MSAFLTVLIVDHHASTVETLTRSLQRVGRFEVVTAFSVHEALELLSTRPPDVVLLDLALSTGSGHALLNRVREAPDAAPVLMVTAHQDGPEIRAAARAGATGFIQQPLNAAEICYKIEQSVCTSRSRAAEAFDLLDARPPSPVCRP
jgi:DNA-binding NtrC family response regulator